MCETAASFKLVAPAKKMQETPVSSGNDEENSNSDGSDSEDGDDDEDDDEDDDDGTNLGQELLGAAFHDQAVEVKRLLEGGVDVNFVGEEGITALLYAAEQKNAAVTELLVKGGADLDAVDEDGHTALHLAAISHVDEEGNTLLRHAEGYRHVGVAKLLLEGRANPNAVDEDGCTALHLAADDGHAALVKLLLEWGANPNAEDGDGHTPLNYAADDDQIVRLLQLAGGLSPAAKPAGKAESTNKNEIDMALCEAACSSDLAKVRHLVGIGASVNFPDMVNCGYGYTPLISAVRPGGLEVVKFLLEKGADVHANDRFGGSALSSALSEAKISTRLCKAHERDSFLEIAALLESEPRGKDLSQFLPVRVLLRVSSSAN